MLIPLAGRDYRCVLVEKQAQMARLLCHLLEGLALEDVTTFPPAHRAFLMDVVERMPAEIPADIVAPLRLTLPESEVAA